MTINKNNATLDEDIYLFRLDKNIELHFTIVNNKYKFEKSDLNNIIAQTNAAYFQIRLYRSDEIKYTFAIQPTQDGVAVLTITDDLINDPIEVGEYDFQISLLDADKTSMISMPIVTKQLHVCEPLVDNQAIMGRAVLGLTNLASGEIKNAFDSEGNYIREIHKDGDILSAQLINKFEEALDTNTKASKDLATKKYVDDGINYDNKQINNKIVAMNISKHPVSCSTEIYKKPLCDIFPELLNITYNTVFRDSNSFKVNMDNFAKEYPTVKSAYNKLNINLYDENDNFIGNSYGNSINGDGLNVIFINITESLRFYAYFDKALVDGSSTTMETKNGYMTIQLLISKGNNKQEFIDKIKNLKLTLSVIRTDFLNLNNETIYTPTSDYNPATKKYVDDNAVNKYSQLNERPIEVFPYTEKLNEVTNVTQKLCTIDVADLKADTTYMCPDNCGRLVLQYTKLDNSKISFYMSYSPNSLIIQTGYKNDKQIEILIDGIVYTVTFKTATEEPKVEQTVRYLTDKNTTEYTPTGDYNPATKKYVDDNILLEQLPILRIDETNKRIYVNCNNMGTYKKYFVPNKYANVYGFSFIYTNEDSSETEIALIGGAMTRDDFILCARNTDTLFILILGGTDKYTYTKSTKTLQKGLYGYLKIGNTQEYAPTENYNPATKKYVDDKVTSLPQLSFNEAGELVVTINGVSKTFVPKS
jgi:hypothetical protein